MGKRTQDPASRRGPKHKLAEPYQPGEVYYDPTQKHSWLGLASIWFGAKYPKTFCLIQVLLFLGVSLGWCFLFIFTLLWAATGSPLGTLLLAAWLLLTIIPLLVLGVRSKIRGVFGKRSLPLGSSVRRKQRQQPDTESMEPLPALPDPAADPAGFAQRLPKQRVHGLPKLRAPRSRSHKKNEKTEPSL